MPNEGESAKLPPVPGVWRLGWMLFMQPIKLHGLFRAWGLEGDPSLIKLWPRLRARDPIVRALVARWAVWLFVMMPLVALMMAAALQGLGIHVTWRGVAVGVAVGVAGGVAVGVAGGVAVGVAVGVAFGVANGVAFGVAFGVAGGVAGGVARGVARGVAGGVARGVARGVANGVANGVAVGVAGGVAVGVAFGVANGVALFHLPSWPLEALAMQILSWRLQWQPSAARRISRLLPFCNHDLIYLPLPGVRSFLVQLAEIDEGLCKEMIAEAAGSVGQHSAARFALAELQARDLERAAAGRLFARAVDLDFPFLPSPNTQDEETMPLLAFQSAARDLIAGGAHQRQRRLAFARARKTIESFRHKVTHNVRPTDLERRLLPTAARWLDVIGDEENKLTREEAEHRDVPTAFIAGPIITPDRPENRGLFKGRDNLIKLIEHDLSPDRRGVLVVVGQRRMGKTSLSQWLPTYLGTGTTVILANFQELVGDSHRESPHRFILEAIAAHHEAASPPPSSPRWGEGLAWLKTIDNTCTDRNILVVIDEVERVEDGIREGWCTPDFLDFLRAAGDALLRIRFLLLTAYPLHRLGEHWVDRLISATSRSISYLDERDARALMVEPIPGFPDIYPEGGVDRILAETAKHPYLLQKVGDDLTRLLNARGDNKATHADLESVFDGVTYDELFDQLWRKRTPEEHAALRRLAASSEPLPPDEAALGLAREGYVERNDGKVSITVPMFRAWILHTKVTDPPE